MKLILVLSTLLVSTLTMWAAPAVITDTTGRLLTPAGTVFFRANSNEMNQFVSRSLGSNEIANIVSQLGTNLVSKIVAGSTNVTISPTNGQGVVTITVASGLDSNAVANIVGQAGYVTGNYTTNALTNLWIKTTNWSILAFQPVNANLNALSTNNGSALSGHAVDFRVSVADSADAVNPGYNGLQYYDGQVGGPNNGTSLPVYYGDGSNLGGITAEQVGADPAGAAVAQIPGAIAGKLDATNGVASNFHAASDVKVLPSGYFPDDLDVIFYTWHFNDTNSSLSLLYCVPQAGTTNNLITVQGSTDNDVGFGGNIHAVGNVRGGTVTATGSIESYDSIYASSNVTAAAFFGDGSQLTGIAVPSGPVTNIVIPCTSGQQVWLSAPFTNKTGATYQECTGAASDGTRYFESFNNPTNGVTLEIRTGGFSGTLIASNYTAPLAAFDIACGMTLKNGLLYVCLCRGIPSTTNAVAIFDTNANFVAVHPLGQEPRIVQQVTVLDDGTALACHFGDWTIYPAGFTNLFYYNTNTWTTNGQTVQLSQPIQLTGFALSSSNIYLLGAYGYGLDGNLGHGVGWGDFMSLWKSDFIGNVNLEMRPFQTNYPYLIIGNPFWMSNDVSRIYIPYQGSADDTNYIGGWSLLDLSLPTNGVSAFGSYLTNATRFTRSGYGYVPTLETGKLVARSGFLDGVDRVTGSGAVTMGTLTASNYAWIMGDIATSAGGGAASMANVFKMQTPSDDYFLFNSQAHARGIIFRGPAGDAFGIRPDGSSYAMGPLTVNGATVLTNAPSTNGYATTNYVTAATTGMVTNNLPNLTLVTVGSGKLTMSTGSGNPDLGIWDQNTNQTIHLTGNNGTVTASNFVCNGANVLTNSAAFQPSNATLSGWATINTNNVLFTNSTLPAGNLSGAVPTNTLPGSLPSLSVTGADTNGAAVAQSAAALNNPVATNLTVWGDSNRTNLLTFSNGGLQISNAAGQIKYQGGTMTISGSLNVTNGITVGSTNVFAVTGSEMISNNWLYDTNWWITNASGTVVQYISNSAAVRLTNTATIVPGTTYLLRYTIVNVTNNNAYQDFSLGGYGNNRSTGQIGNYAMGVAATLTNRLMFVSSGGNDCTISNLSLVAITNQPASFVISSNGVTTFEVRSAGNNTFVGKDSGSYNYLVYSNSALAFGVTNFGYGNVGLGVGALSNNVTGSYNTALGFNALGSNALGSSCIAIGAFTMDLSPGASFNVVPSVGIGNYALRKFSNPSSSAAGCVAIGNKAMMNLGSAGDGNVAIGNNAMTAATGSSACVTIGSAAGTGLTTGTYNTFVGGSSGASATTSTSATAIGYLTGYSITANSLNAVFLGASAGYNALQKVNVTNSIAVGANTFTTTNNQIVLGDSNITTVVTYGSITTAGSVVVTNGVGSLNTNSYTLNATGYTNTSGITVVVNGLIGTTMTLYDAKTNSEWVAFTTLTPGIQIRIQPNGSLVGTGISGTIHAW